MAATNEKAVKAVETEEKAVPQEEKIEAIYVRDEFGNKYRLEFTPRVVKTMERKGFKVDMDYPLSTADALFEGAFQSRYNGKISKERIDKIWDSQTHKLDLLTKLVTLYMNPVKEFLEDPEGAGENADPTWEVV